MPLVTVDEAVDYLDLGTLSTDEEAALEALIDRVSEDIESDLRWYFGNAREKVEILDGTGTQKLVLHQPPVDPDAVTVEYREGVGGTWNEIADTLWEIEDRILYADGVWARGKRIFRVTYEEGFAEVPGDIQQLALEVIGAAWGSRDVSAVGIVTESIGDYSYSKGVLDVSDATSYRKVAGRWRRLRL